MKRRLLSRCLVIMLSTAVGTLATSVPTPFALAKKKTAAKSTPVKTDAAQSAEGGEADKVRVERGTGGRKVYKIEGAIVIPIDIAAKRSPMRRKWDLRSSP